MGEGLDFYKGLEFSLGGFNEAYTKSHRHVPLYYGIQYNHEGGLSLRIGGGERIVRYGPCAFISHPGAFFEYGSIDGEPRHHNFVCFHGPRAKSYIEGGLLEIGAPCPLVDIKRPERFLQTLHELIAAVHSGAFSHDRMVQMLEELLLQMKETEVEERRLPPEKEPLFAKLASEIAKSPARDWDFQKEAKALSMTETHFRRLFKQFAGKAPRQFLIQSRLRLAADLLINSRKPLGEIARESGVGSEFYFSRLFKSRHSISPLAYRKEFMGR